MCYSSSSTSSTRPSNASSFNFHIPLYVYKKWIAYICVCLDAITASIQYSLTIWKKNSVPRQLMMNSTSRKEFFMILTFFYSRIYEWRKFRDLRSSYCWRVYFFSLPFPLTLFITMEKVNVRMVKEILKDFYVFIILSEDLFFYAFGKKTM